MFTKAGLHYRTTEYITEEIWSKFRINVCNNLPQAVVGAGMGCYRDSEHIEAIRVRLRRELEAVAAAKCIDMEKSIQCGREDDYYTGHNAFFYTAGSGCRSAYRDRYVLWGIDKNGKRAGNSHAL